MARLGGTTALGQQLKTVVELGLQAHQRQCADLGRRQLYRQGQTVEPATDLANRDQILLTQYEVLLAGTSAADEQLNRRIAHGLLHAVQRRSRRYRQRWQALHTLVAGAQWLTAGDQDRQPRGRRQQPLDQGPTAIAQMGAVIQHQQGMPFNQAMQLRVQLQTAG